MKIQAVKLYENGFMTQPFAMGGEDGQEKFDASVKYRSSIQNYVIETDDEVILVDTGIPAETPQPVADPNAFLFVGTRVNDYLTALAKLGYKPEQVTKILITHKHSDHTGEVRSFPNAKVYASAEEAKSDELQNFANVVPVEFTDGAYHNFPASQKIAEGIYMVPAVGHTTGNSLIIAESDGLYYMLHGDITYTDEALYENKLSIVYADKAAARETLDRVREFIQNNPAVYCGTHTPLGYENLEAKRVVDLNNMPAPIPPVEIAASEGSGKYICSVCGHVYDPEVGDPEYGIPAGTKFKDLPNDWGCPRCKQGKDKFQKA